MFRFALPALLFACVIAGCAGGGVQKIVAGTNIVGVFSGPYTDTNRSVIGTALVVIGVDNGVTGNLTNTVTSEFSPIAGTVDVDGNFAGTLTVAGQPEDASGTIGATQNGIQFDLTVPQDSAHSARITAARQFPE